MHLNDGAGAGVRDRMLMFLFLVHDFAVRNDFLHTLLRRIRRRGQRGRRPKGRAGGGICTGDGGAEAGATGPGPGGAQAAGGTGREAGVLPVLHGGQEGVGEAGVRDLLGGVRPRGHLQRGADLPARVPSGVHRRVDEVQHYLPAMQS